MNKAESESERDTYRDTNTVASIFVFGVKGFQQTFPFVKQGTSSTLLIYNYNGKIYNKYLISYFTIRGLGFSSHEE